MQLPIQLPTILPCLVAGVLATAIPDVSSTLQNILKNTDNSNKYRYPTDLTRGIIPKPFHSHNDYWRDVPFYSGLSWGAISTEADVWLINETLYVGHEISALTTARTLSSLYIEPILDTLHRQNPSTAFTQFPTSNGVFDTSSGQTLYLFIDFKTAGPETFSAVQAALEPLQKGKWLTTSDGKSLTTRPVTVIGTGNTPLDLVRSQNPRFIFYDAPLSKLGRAAANAEFSDLTENESPIASTNFADSFGDVRKLDLNDTQLDTLRSQVDAAHKRGIKARYWNQPEWPIATRNAIWRTLWDEGVDILNVDDLEAAAEFWTGRG
ncbi:hypothetical protein BU24DRAFT_417064 [Aaosphaeria arxii CBS 175.79]|uniref:Uncharacterized protein n=1 Tax=Aaosphaeria arxii CBS 175.79 TaxID=1450172 RepID=A0A6A5Y9H6_9PLEO|nr:uncharacterized protein BU24DRAFT_417064 [Aaosphaeria arxii CBS 175.79]KAF2021401.1 hypothetical protein BU24DRAFT_417064 [Aaosphaeria arxii CBS 175.79]